MVVSDISNISEFKQGLQTAILTLGLEKSSRSVDKITSDEDVRKLKCHILLLRDEIESLNEQLADEEERADGLEQRFEDVQTQADELDAETNRLSNHLRTRSRELENTRAELTALQTISNDSTKVLTEKLALTREVALLRPEIDSLRTQAATNKDLLAEKLSLQRQLTTVQVELENSQRTAQRALARAGKTSNDDSEYEAQIDQLQQQLRAARLAQRESDREMEQLRQDAALPKDAGEKSTSKDDSNRKAEIDGLRKDLAAEKREKQKVEKAFRQEQTVWEAQKSLLDEKLNQFRTKLRSTKDRLKEVEEELQNAQAAAPAKPADAGLKNPRKRSAGQMDPDAAIGTPGLGPPAKRGKRNTSMAMPGDKSTFSITPFLNRTMSIAPETPPVPAEDPQKVSDAAEVDAVAQDSPLAPAGAKKAGGRKSALKLKPLSQSSTGKHNAKAAPRKTSIAPTLEKVTEETSEVNAEIAKPTLDNNNNNNNDAAPALVPKLKATATAPPRKSLVTFATFNEEPAPEKRKKRKLGGTKKTLFDEDEDAPPPKPIPGKGLWAGRAQGGASNAKPMFIFGAKGKSGGNSMTADNGFQFSPLKRDRRTAAAANS